MGLIDQNREAIEKLIVFQDKLVRNTNGHVNLESITNPPESESPIPDKGLEWAMDTDNAYTALFVEPLIRELRGKSYQGYDLFAVVCEAGYREADHSALKRWREGKSAEDRSKAEAFKTATLLISQVLSNRHPSMRLVVKVQPDEEQAQNKTEARDQARRITVQDSYRLLAPKVLALMEKDDYSKTAAVTAVAEKEDTSPARVWRALAHVEKETA